LPKEPVHRRVIKVARYELLSQGLWYPIPLAGRASTGQDRCRSVTATFIANWRSLTLIQQSVDFACSAAARIASITNVCTDARFLAMGGGLVERSISFRQHSFTVTAVLSTVTSYL